MPLKIKISKNFSPNPGPRSKDEGDYSGEQFREDVLLPKVKEAMGAGEKLEIDLDGTAGYGTSFLEEAFGGLVRDHHLTYEQAKRLLTFVSEEETYLPADIDEYMQDAAQAE